MSAALAGVALAGCASHEIVLPEAKRVASSTEAASVHLAAFNVVPWEEAASALQPQYPMTANTALGLALPRTSITQEAMRDVFSAGLQVGLPQSTQTLTESETLTSGATVNTGATGAGARTATAASATDAAGATAATSGSTATGNATTTSTMSTSDGATVTQTTTRQRSPGTLPPNLLPAVAAPNATTLTGPTGTVALDPLLTYQAATAIYQEVQLLNTYVKDAALRYGYVPYLGRVQVSVVPFAHNQPYDVYVNLATFSRCRMQDAEAPVLTIPLLVTDDVETGQVTSALDYARQLALSLGGVVGNTALQAGLSDLKDQFKAILGTDYNSLYMVTRASDNVIQVRLGAARSPNANVGYSMAAQTHNVSFLMLVEKKYAAGEGGGCFSQKPDVQAEGETDEEEISKRGPQVWISAYTRLRDAISGEELMPDRAVIGARASALMQRFLPAGAAAATVPEIQPLLVSMQSNEMSQFRTRLGELWCNKRPASERVNTCPSLPSGIAESLWSAMAVILNMSEFAGTIANLPRSQAIDVEPLQAVWLRDNCRDTTTATITGFRPSVPTQLDVRLTLPPSAGGTSVVLVPSSMTASGGTVVLRFPSLKTFTALPLEDRVRLEAVCREGAAAPAAPPSPKMSATLLVRPVESGRWTATGDAGPAAWRFSQLYYEGASARSVSVAVTAAADTIAAAPGAGAAGATGQLRLLLTAGRDLTHVMLSFSGAAVTSVPSSNLATIEADTQPPASLKVTPPNGAAFGTVPIVIDVPLQGLVATRTVSVTATGRDAHGAQSTATIAVPVVAGTAPK